MKIPPNKVNSHTYRGRKKALSTVQAAELAGRAAAGEPKAALAREYGISRETVYQYIRQPTHKTKLGGSRHVQKCQATKEFECRS